MWLSKVDHRFLENMFQKPLLGQRNLIELINVDERKTIQVQFRIPFLAEINTVRIVSPEESFHGKK